KKHPYKARKSDPTGLTEARTLDALQRPLGAYFRVNHKDLVAMHSAIAEVGILYTTCTVHQGWMQVGPDGVITPSDDIKGGHAFAIVAYDDEGFWLQNSWGPGWGRGGFARVSYDDWLRNGTDAWVARLGAPVQLRRAESAAAAHAPTAAQSMAYAFADLRPHIVSVGNGGELKAGGDYGSTPAELAQVFEHDIPRVTAGWARPRVLLYAHGGLVSEEAAVQRLAEYRPRLLEGEVYPLAFIWRTDYWTTLTNILQDAVRRRRPEGALDAAKDFMLDRFDDALEPLARAFTGKVAWDKMKENAMAASTGHGAAVRVADHLQALAATTPGLEIHLVGHSAGAIFCAPLVRLLADRGLKIHTCTLWAPACSVALFDRYYQPALEQKQIGKMAAFMLNDEAEQDDHCARIYNKSLLYLVSHAFEENIRIPFSKAHRGTPILGMAHWHDAALRARLDKLGVDRVMAPNTEPAGSLDASNARHHGDFDDDERTVLATFGRIAAAGAAGAARASAARTGQSAATPRKGRGAPSEQVPMFSRSGSSLRDQRQQIDLKTR
ncbi:MAG: peptidase C1, partial [Comamonadaceae bacterium]